MAEQNVKAPDIDYAARVAKGVALLDAKRPDWAQEIDLETLDIENGSCCITAQLSGESDWQEGMRQLDLGFRSYTEHGFRVDDEFVVTDYPALNTLWREVIEGRLSVSPGPAAG